MRKKVLPLLLALAMVFSLAAPAFAAETEEDGIVVLFTNDVHCTDDDGSSYAAIAGYKAEMEAVYGTGNVTLVDNGDAIQGGVLGSLSKGSWIVDIMNEVGYDLAIPGNHEFDFNMDTFMDIVSNQAEYTYLSCNFMDLEANEPVLEPYQIITYGDVDVAYVGITTPETLTKAAPAYFQNEDKKYIYGFCQGNNGQDLYDQVQDTVDAALAEGADYVVALAHLGVDPSSTPYMSTEVIANTTGIDVMLDGHSHTVVPSQSVENADGEKVLLAQTGTKAESIGKLVIAPDGTMTTQLVALADVDTTTEGYTAAMTFIEGIQALYDETADQVVATSDVELTVNDPDTGERAVRSAETNLGDLCADAYRVMLEADIGWVNGGGVRANIAAGDVTYGDIIEVHPYSNLACLVEVTGQQILDALEWGSKDVGVGENGGFLQVSGLKYTINTAILSSAESDPEGNFAGVTAGCARRVSDVQVLDSETGAYAPIDPEATYTLASHDYMLKNGGDGYAMFGEDNITILKDEIMVDNEVLIRYIQDELGGVIGEEYANPRGQGRITIVNEPADTLYNDVTTSNWYYEAVEYVTENGIMQGVGGGNFDPKGTTTRGAFMTMLARYAGVDTSGSSPWYQAGMDWAVEEGVSDGSNPYGGVTRVQVVAMMWRFLGAHEYEADLSRFSDVDEIPGWSGAREAIEWAVDAGVMQGSDGQLNPNGIATRAEIAQLMMKFCESIKG